MAMAKTRRSAEAVRDRARRMKWWRRAKNLPARSPDRTAGVAVIKLEGRSKLSQRKGVGWTLAIILIAGLRQRMRYSDVPVPFRGVAIAMVITGVMAMAFMGFAGMVRIQ